ncbi:MAG: hypothetical protein LBE56_05705 [Tannerella sp.]|nr:hypothetical protein [Tannerella sp.]
MKIEIHCSGQYLLILNLPNKILYRLANCITMTRNQVAAGSKNHSFRVNTGYEFFDIFEFDHRVVFGVNLLLIIFRNYNRIG